MYAATIIAVRQRGRKMSVIVERAESYRCCNSCGSNNDVLNITALMKFRQGKQGTQMALCSKCAEDLQSCLKVMINCVGSGKYERFDQQTSGN